MTKSATQRRQAKRSERLVAAHQRDSFAFKRMWDSWMSGWLSEVRTRTRDQKIGACAERSLRVFEVLTIARKQAQSAGVISNPHVALTLITLQHECAKAVASINDPRLYSFSEYATSRIPR